MNRLNILVCIKNTLDPQSRFRIDSDSRSIGIEGAARYEINPYDEHALEEALKIKDSNSRTRIDLVLAGPAHAESALRRGLGMGADHGIHLESDSDYLDQAWFVAHGIHDSIGLEDYDLILCGVMSQDLCQGQVGPMIAGILGIPVVSSVIGLNLDPARNRITVVKEMEQATRQRITLEPPAVITIQTGSSQPRYPSLSNTLRAKKQELETISLKDYTPARKGSITQGVRHALPSRNGLFLDGPVEEKAKRLKDILREKGLL